MRAIGMIESTPKAADSGSDRTFRTLCVLVHGFNGEPGELCELEGRLNEAGVATRNLLLPGHGTTIREFAASTWDDWVCAVHEAVRCGLNDYRQVALVGHSMGAGAALAAAAREPGVAGVAALCPPLRMRPALRLGVAALRRFIRYVPAGVEDVRYRRGARERYARNVYRWTALDAAHSLFHGLIQLRDDLPKVRCPALVICAWHDHVVSVRDGIETYALLGSQDRRLVVLERLFHAVTRDVERETVFAEVGRFCRSVAPQVDRMADAAGTHG
ncbi:MAG TPA: alpha/beta fold hydrolase [Ktedonobacterales bacterium]|nr:alpha/beta fold hydrolase [Ktedonobacterales bacterium]